MENLTAYEYNRGVFCASYMLFYRIFPIFDIIAKPQRKVKCFSYALSTIMKVESEEIGRLYQQSLASEPLVCMVALFAALNFPQPQEEAVRFYAPMFLLYGVYDGTEDKRAVLSMTDSLLENARKRLKGANVECG